MAVQWITKMVKVAIYGEEVEKEVGRFQYKFMDYLFKGDAGQDYTQVAAAIEKIVERIHQEYPDAKEIIFQSDNSTCFASQELIPSI